MVTVTLGVLTTTSHYVEGRSVREYLGIVGGEAAVIMRRRDGLGATLSGAGELDLDYARQRALSALARRASERGATVVIAVHINYLALGIGKLLVTATGTAARL